MELYNQEPSDPHPDFVKGFNEGYILGLVAPEIGGLFGAYVPDTERGRGFRKGKEQVAYEDKSTPNRESMKDHRVNQLDMGIKETPADKMNTFQQAKIEQNLSKQKHPKWLQDKEQNQADIGIASEPEIEKEVDDKSDRNVGDIEV